MAGPLDDLRATGRALIDQWIRTSYVTVVRPDVPNQTYDPATMAQGGGDTLVWQGPAGVVGSGAWSMGQEGGGQTVESTYSIFVGMDCPATVAGDLVTVTAVDYDTSTAVPGDEDLVGAVFEVYDEVVDSFGFVHRLQAHRVQPGVR